MSKYWNNQTEDEYLAVFERDERQIKVEEWCGNFFSWPKIEWDTHIKPMMTDADYYILLSKSKKDRENDRKGNS